MSLMKILGWAIGISAGAALTILAAWAYAGESLRLLYLCALGGLC